MKFLQIIGVVLFIGFLVALILGLKTKNKNCLILAVALFIITGACVYIDSPESFTEKNVSKTMQEEKTKKEETLSKKSKKKYKYKTKLDWADHKNYMFAVEVDSFDGDVINKGKYNFFTTGTSDNDHTLIVWDIYVSNNMYANISELLESEYVTSVGGNENTSAAIDLTSGQYVYIKFNKSLLKQSGILKIEIVD